MPAQPLIVAIYLASIIQHSSSPAPVLSAYYGLRWAHNLVGTTSPTDANLVKNILEAAKRRLAHPCIKKEPVTPELLKTYYDSFKTYKSKRSEITLHVYYSICRIFTLC